MSERSRSHIRTLPLPCLALAAVLLAGCGSGRQPEPRLPRLTADRLLAGTRAVEAAFAKGDGCAARAAQADLQRSSLALLNAGRVPQEFQEELQAAVGDLVSRPAPACSRPAPAAEPERHGKGEGNGRHKGRGKGKGHD